MQVAPGVGDLRMNSGDLAPLLPSVLSVAFPARKAALRNAQFLQFPFQRLHRRDLLAVARRDERLDPNIQANCCPAMTRSGPNVIRFTRQHNEPLIHLAADRDRLDLAFPRAVPVDADKTDVLEADLIAAQLHAVAERGIGAAVKPVPRLETGITQRFARFGAAEERLKGSVQAAHRSLRGREVQAGEIRIRLPLLFEPAALIGVLHRVPMRLVCIAALLQAGIVKPAMRFERDLDLARLVGVWLQAVFERAKHNLIIMVSAVLVQGSAGEKGRRKRIPLSPEGDSPLRLNSMAAPAGLSLMPSASTAGQQHTYDGSGVGTPSKLILVSVATP